MRTGKIIAVLAVRAFLGEAGQAGGGQPVRTGSRVGQPAAIGRFRRRLRIRRTATARRWAGLAGTGATGGSGAAGT